MPAPSLKIDKADRDIAPPNYLYERASAVIRQHPHLQRRGVRLEAQDGHLVLRGVVSSYYQKSLAQEALRHIEGVEDIQNDLEVRW